MKRQQFEECTGRIADAIRMAMDLAEGSVQAEDCVRDLAGTTARQFSQAAGWSEDKKNEWFKRAGFPR